VEASTGLAFQPAPKAGAVILPDEFMNLAGQSEI
jgi:hypothetical protein